MSTIEKKSQPRKNLYIKIKSKRNKHYKNLTKKNKKGGHSPPPGKRSAEPSEGVPGDDQAQGKRPRLVHAEDKRPHHLAFDNDDKITIQVRTSYLI